MLFLMILIGALIRGVVVYLVGAVLAVLMWVPCLIFRLPVPSMFRWSLAAFLVGLNLYLYQIPINTKHGETDSLMDLWYAVGPAVNDTTGWENMNFGTNLTLIIIALLALCFTGTLISTIKALFKGGRKLAKVAASKSAEPE